MVVTATLVQSDTPTPPQGTRATFQKEGPRLPHGRLDDLDAGSEYDGPENTIGPKAWVRLSSFLSRFLCVSIFSLSPS